MPPLYEGFCSQPSRPGPSCFQNLQQVVTARSHAWIADEPLPDGDGLGSNPYELLLAALGT